MKMTWCGWKIKNNCHVMLNQFHGNYHYKTLSCWKITSVFRDVKWCFNASWGLKGLNKDENISQIEFYNWLSSPVNILLVSVAYYLALLFIIYIKEGYGAMVRAWRYVSVAACRAVSNSAWCRIFREISCFSRPAPIAHSHRLGLVTWGYQV